MHIPTETGHWVDETFERLARVVQDYSPQFELRWIPPDQRDTLQEKAKPFVIVDLVTNTPIMYASHDDTPTKILEELFMGDNTKGDVLARLDAHNAAIQALQMKEQMDIAEEKRDYAAFLIGTNKNYIRLSGGRVVDDQLRPVSNRRI